MIKDDYYPLNYVYDYMKKYKFKAPLNFKNGREVD